MEEDTDNTTIDNNEYTINNKEILYNFISIMKGENDILMRSTNILHVLGSVTVSNYYENLIIFNMCSIVSFCRRTYVGSSSKIIQTINYKHYRDPFRT